MTANDKSKTLACAKVSIPRRLLPVDEDGPASFETGNDVEAKIPYRPPKDHSRREVYKV